ncbi:hypothetical protein N665_2591s0004 [Sinapis alba]|nr:hypothetical protein N665_2591s0004 [Sinapis alba]
MESGASTPNKHEMGNAEAAPTAIEATNPLDKGQKELSDEFNTKLKLENQNEESDEVNYSSSSDYSDVEEKEEPMIVNPQPPRPTTTGGSRRLFVCNLAYQVKKSDIKEFFQEVGQVVDVKFAMGPDGSFRGFGHILFASHEEAQKALGFHCRIFFGREIRLDMALERSKIR